MCKQIQLNNQIIMEDMEDMVVMADIDITAAMKNSLMNRKKRQVR